MAGAQNVTTSSTYDPATGFVLSQTDALGFTTHYQYDILGRVTVVTYPAVNGVVAFTTYGYDDTNNVLTTTDENGNMAKQYYDGLGRLTRTEAYNGTTLYSTETYVNNWDSQVVSKTTATGSVYTYSYDSFGRVVRATNPDGTFATTSYNDTSNVKTVTDENGHQTQYAYDWNGRLTSVREYYAPAKYYLTTYTYDQVGNLLTTTDANGQTTSYQYDDLNRLVKTTYPDGTSEGKTYDSVGNLLTRTDPAGAQFTYSYDSLNRLTKVAYPDSSSVSYAYDANGDTVSMVDPSSSTYYSYDARGWLTNDTKVVSGGRYSFLYSYDRAGNMVSMAYPDGYNLTMTYDALNRVRTLGTSTLTLGAFTYTLDGKIRTITYGNGEVATYSYDSLSRPTRILVVAGSTKRMDLNYTYDGTGNVLSINAEKYGYDWLNRLNSSSYPGGWGSVTYAYDGVGNRLSMVQGGATTTYSYGAYNRLTGSRSSMQNVTYAYDANGNLVGKNDGISSWKYTYDYENRLVGVQRGGVTVEQMVYDGNGRQIEDITAAGTVVSLWQGFDIVFTKALGTGTTTKYFMANGLRVAEMVNSTVYYYHEDLLGSVRLLSTASAATAFSSNYAPYGPGFAAAGTEMFQYTGKPLDAVTGYYDYGARYYDPSTGRFITQDSRTGVQEDPQSLNRYAYARNNPERLVDPNGHSWLSALTSTVSAGVSKVGADLSGMLSAAQNTWAGLPPTSKDAIILGLSLVVIGATAGAATPLVLASAAVLGTTSVAGYAGSSEAMGGKVTPQGALDAFTLGFTIGAAAEMSVETRPVPKLSSQGIGVDRELTGQDVLANEGRQTGRGWFALTSTDRVQIDLVDLSTGDLYDSKTNFVDQIPVNKAGLLQSDRQAALIGQKVDLIHPQTGAVIPDFQVNSYTWMSISRAGGDTGFRADIAGRLRRLGIGMREVG